MDGAEVWLVPLPEPEGGRGKQGGRVKAKGLGKGRYRTTEVTPHRWRLTVRKPQFKTSSRKVSIRDQARQSLEVTLER